MTEQREAGAEPRLREAVATPYDEEEMAAWEAYQANRSNDVLRIRWQLAVCRREAWRTGYLAAVAEHAALVAAADQMAADLAAWLGSPCADCGHGHDVADHHSAGLAQYQALAAQRQAVQ